MSDNPQDDAAQPIQPPDGSAADEAQIETSVAAQVPADPEESEPDQSDPDPPSDKSAVPEKVQTVTARGVAKNLVVVAIFLVFTLVVGVAFAYYGINSVPGGNGGASATTVSQGATPTVVAGDASVTVNWSATTLANSRAVTGYLVKRYEATSLVLQSTTSGCAGTLTATTCTESNLPTGQWRYSVTPSFATSWVGPESGKSANVSTVEKDVTPPVNAISMSVLTGAAVKNANTITYRGSVAGSLTLTNAVVDSASGPASSTTQALSGTSTGWTHTPSTVSTPDDGPYVSNPFSWAAGTTSPPQEAVIGRDVKTNSATTTLTFVNDSTAPVAVVTSTNGYTSGRSVPVTFSASDAGIGLANTRQLQRATAALSTSGACGTFSGFAKIGPLNPTSVYTDTQVTNDSCYKYRYVVSDLLGNQTIATTTNVSKVDYGGAVSGTSGLLSQWRLGEKLAVEDSFTGGSGTLISSRSGETGASWTKWVNDVPSAVLTDANRLRRNGTGGVTYLASGVPPVANYQVATDVLLKSRISGDYAGVVGRALTSDTTGQGTRYSARYSSDAQAWELLSIVGGAGDVLGSSAQVLTVNRSYRLSLDMTGSTIRLLVDGVEVLSATDTSITGAGRAGVRLGAGTVGSAPSNTTGMHVDNFKVTPRALDSRGSNPGVYVNEPTLGVDGALAGDSDTAAVFDGIQDYVQMQPTTGLPVGAAPRSVEAWFKTTNSGRQVLFNYGTKGTQQEFGLWIASGGTSLVAWGLYGDKTFALPAPVNDGAWHYVVKTFDGTSITLYVDGVALPAQAATRATAVDSYGFGIGAVIVPNEGNSGGYFNGALDEVSFYTSVLTQAVVSDHYALGSSAPADTAGPTGGSVQVTGLVGTGSRYSTSTSLDLQLASGADPSGIGDSGAQLLRATATLTSSGGANGVCGTFGTYALISGGTDPDASISDTVTDQACYSYRYVVPDSLGNTTTYTSAEIKVETTPPTAPSLSFSALTNAYWSGGSSSVVYYRSAASSGSFTVTASSTDLRSGIASYAFPAPNNGWTTTAGALGVSTYSWSGSAPTGGTDSVTATNNATLTSPASPITATADDTAPSSGTLSYPPTGSGSVDVSFTTGTDTGAGVGTRLLQRASATLTGTTCGTFGSFATVTNGTNPASPLANSVAAGACYAYRYVVSDNVGNSTTTTSATVLKVAPAYASTVQSTAGLLSYWRLGESVPGTADTFTGTTGTVLSAHATDSGATWARRSADTITAVLTNQGRLRKSNASGGVGYYSSDLPATPDYTVKADLVVKSLVGGAGVFGRLDPSGAGTGTYYFARYDTGAGQWQLIRNVNGIGAVIGTYTQALTVGSTYRLSLDLNGSAIAMLVNDSRLFTVTDTSITAAGRPGVGFGEPGDAAVVSDTQGLHLDNFSVSGRMNDSSGANDGTYYNEPTMRAPGALNGDADTAVTFDGVSEHSRVARQIADDLSIEFWFKSTQGIGTGGQWWEGAGLVDAEVNSAANDFGVSLRSDGRVVGGIGSPTGSDVSIVSSVAGLNNGSWHHVAFTRVRSTGAIRLYVDGALVASGTAGTNSLTAQPTLSFGRLASDVNYYAGSLDEVAVYNTALTAATVSSHYSAR